MIFSFFLFCAITCEQITEHYWECKEQIPSNITPDDPNYNGEPFICTNCTYLTAAECEYRKQWITECVVSLRDSIGDLNNELRATFDQINPFFDEIYGNEYGYYLDWSSISTTSGTDSLYSTIISSYPQFACPNPNQCWTADKRRQIVSFLQSSPFFSQFVMVPSGFDLSSNQTIQFQYAAGYESVQQFSYYVENMLNSLWSLQFRIADRIDTLNSTANSIQHVCDNTDCTARTIQFPGSGEGSGGGGTSSICEQFLEQILSEVVILKSSVKDIEDYAKSIDKNVTALLDEAKKANKYLGRIDSFLSNDISNSVKKINFYTDSILSYTNTVNKYDTISNILLSTNDYNVATRKALEIATNSFDVESYYDLDWFSRIESSLLRIALKDETISTNDFEDISIDSLKDTEDQIKELSFTQSSETFLTVLQQFQRTFDKLARLFTDEHRLPNSLDLGISFAGDETLKFDIPQDIAMACRVVSQLLWNVLFGIIAFKLFLFVYHIVIRVFIFRILYKLVKDIL